MRSLDRKLWRDLWSMRGQAFAIALVITGGVATFVMSLSTLDSLRTTRSTFYENYRFAEAFASLKRGPENLKARIMEIPGVDQVETRVKAEVKLDIPGFTDPVTAQLVSIPDDGEPVLNRVYLRRGRTIEPGRTGEVIIGEAFANAHGFSPGDKIDAIINGRKKTLTIVGVALSPEYIYQLSPGAMFPDFKRYAVMWMGRTPLGVAYDMEGAFNDVAVTLSKEAVLEDVIDRLDEILEPYGGLGAVGRKDQISHRYLSEEFRQLAQMATIFPVIFLGVAAFLLNVVVTRLVSTQREQVAILKAFGYSNIDIGLHYLKLVVLIVVLGVAGGVAVGVWLGHGLSGMYTDFFRLPFLKYELRPGVVLTASLISVAAAALGTFFSVRRAALQPPAEAMRPEPPAFYRETIIERMGLKALFDQPTRMIVRHLERRPVKALLTIIGISFSCAVMMVGSFHEDSINFMVDVQFGLSQREDLAVTFTEPTSRKALFELKNLRGVENGEPFRAVPVRLRFQHRSYLTAIEGVESGGELHRLLTTEFKKIELPPSGIVLTDYLGKILGVRPGDVLTVEVLEGSRPVRQVAVAGLASRFIGLSGYMELSALNRFMGEGNAISGAYLAIDTLHEQEIFRALNEMPRVAGTIVRERAIANFYETMAETILIFISVITLLGGSITFGVVYNSARIILSERSRELASLRVLGFTRGEISYIMLGELTLLTLAAIPVGFVIGRALCAYVADNLQTELYRIPLVLEASTYAFSALVVLVSACISALIVRRKLDKLDLIAVLKTKE